MIAVLDRIAGDVDSLRQKLRTQDPESLTQADLHALHVLISELTALVRLAETA